MPSRPDLREIATNIKDAFADADRETLLEILTFVVKEYVVEGPPPMLIHQAETLSDLKNISFAQLVTALQTRFDFPELAMFVVDGDQVSVRIGGVVQPLLASRQPLTPAADLPRPQAGVRVVETSVQQRPAPAQAERPQQAPPPARGVSLRGRPSAEPAAGAAQPAAPAAPAGNVPTQPTGPAAASPPRPRVTDPSGPGSGPEREDKPEGSGDDASARFSLLELD